MTTDAIVVLLVAVVLLWGGLAASVTAAIRHTRRARAGRTGGDRPRGDGPSGRA